MCARACGRPGSSPACRTPPRPRPTACDDNNTAQLRADRSCTRSSNAWCANGSNRFAGSSMITRSGRCCTACAIRLLTHPRRVGADRSPQFFRTETDPLERPGVVGRVRPLEPGEEIEVLRPGQGRVERRVGRHEPDTAACTRLPHRDSEDPSITASRAKNADEQAQQCRLSRAVGAEQAGSCSRLDDEVDALNPGHRPIELGDLPALDRCGFGFHRHDRSPPQARRGDGAEVHASTAGGSAPPPRSTHPGVAQNDAVPRTE